MMPGVRIRLFPSYACVDKFKIYYDINTVLNIFIGATLIRPTRLITLPAN